MAYIEFDTDEEVEKFQEADARQYAKDNGLPYPWEPTRYGPGCRESRKPENHIRKRTAVQGNYDENGDDLPGGFFEADADSRARAGKTIRLGDGVSHTIESAEKTREQLSAKARATADDAFPAVAVEIER